MAEPSIAGTRAARVRIANDRPPRPDRDFVLYWMTAARRTSWSFAIDRAVDWARTLDRPLVVLEALRVDYPWASDRLHRFILDGMRDQADALEHGDALYYPYVEPERRAAKGLLAALAERACVVVTDYFPSFFLPHMLDAAARKISARLEVVDGNGLMPLALHDKDYPAASHFRRHAQGILPECLRDLPTKTPLARRSLPPAKRGLVPKAVLDRWPAAGRALLDGDAEALARLPIDHDVPPAPTRGGERAGSKALRRFVRERLDAYADAGDHPDADGTSRLSPYLHFGHVSAHAVFDAVARAEGWTPDRLADRPTGSREGWWSMGPGAEAFVEQLVVWRELAYNTCHQRPGDYDDYASLPAWARGTLEAHEHDPRPHVYSRRAFERADTHDPLWNAAERQLLGEGWFHNYLRMLWGKKILEWSRSPRDALRTMIEVMNRWSLDGRDPSSYGGYFWVLGRYDRPWPERPIYGKVRSMSSERTRAKVGVERTLERFG